MSSASPLDPKAFRQALGTFTTGVTIITTRTPQGEPVGLTANSFNSVSLDPPMVLWSLAKTSRNLAVFEAAEHWAVHILSADQEDLSNRFAKSVDDKFVGVSVDEGIGKVPLLHGCTTRLQCKASFKYEGGDHLIFVGEVLRFDSQPIAPLVFHAGQYAVATRKPAAPHNLSATFGEDFLGFLLTRAHVDLYDRVNAVYRAASVDDEEFFLLSCLLGREGQTLAELNQVFSRLGQQAAPGTLQSLLGRGLLQSSAASGVTTHSLTDAGRQFTLQLLAEIKAMESALLGKLGSSEALSLKSLLRQLLQVTEAAPPAASAAAVLAPPTLHP
jgi:3-hydroxy-9,10-secoandrosta-1,3,5(10)-triene-9,17-dione monooxygenase reductase component